MFFASTAYGLQHLLQFPEIPKEPCLVMCTIMFDRKLIPIISFSWSSLGPITLVPFQFRNECSLLDSSFINDSHIQSWSLHIVMLQELIRLLKHPLAYNQILSFLWNCLFESCHGNDERCMYFYSQTWKLFLLAFYLW